MNDWEKEHEYHGDEEQLCPKCGLPMSKRYDFSDWWCDNCHCGLDDDEDEGDDGERLSVYEAAQIWVSNGKDEDYMFGYSAEELEDAL